MAEGESARGRANAARTEVRQLAAELAVQDHVLLMLRRSVSSSVEKCLQEHTLVRRGLGLQIPEHGVQPVGQGQQGQQSPEANDFFFFLPGLLEGTLTTQGCDSTGSS